MGEIKWLSVADPGFGKRRVHVIYMMQLLYVRIYIEKKSI